MQQYNCLFYGSLRQGEYNQQYFDKGDFNFLQTVIIEGYKLYSLGSYPGIKKTGKKEDTIICDAVIINNKELFNSIDRMELGAGYSRETVKVTLDDGNTLDFILYPYEGNVRALDLVKSGDWSEFLKEEKEKLNTCVE